MTAEPNQYRCETCSHYLKYAVACNKIKERVIVGADEWIEKVGCASHSDFQTERDTCSCEHQRIEVYPDDKFVYCQSKIECEHQSFGSDGLTIWCNKPLGKQSERDKVLDEVVKHCSERALESHDDESYIDSEMESLVEWIEEELRQSKQDGEQG